MVDICQEGCVYSPASQNWHKEHPTGAWKLRLGLWRDKTPCIRGECARQAPGFLSCLGWERHKMQAQRSLRFCGIPENWNCTQLGARSTESSREPEQMGKADAAGANPVWLEHCESSPHTPAVFICSAPPSPQHD